jgi:hypothetical protein
MRLSEAPRRHDQLVAGTAVLNGLDHPIHERAGDVLAADHPTLEVREWQELRTEAGEQRPHHSPRS